MIEFNRLKCCGIVELDGLRTRGNYYPPVTPLQQLKQLAVDISRVPLPAPLQMGNILRHSHFLFNGAGSEGYLVPYAEEFAAEVESQNLGTVTKLPSNYNSNSGNYVTPYMWTVDHAAWKAFCIRAFTEALAEEEEKKEAAKKKDAKKPFPTQRNGGSISVPVNIGLQANPFVVRNLR